LDLRRQNDEVVSAYRGQLYEISVLVEVIRILLIMRDQLLVVLGAAHEMVLDKLNQPLSVTVRLVLKVKAFCCLDNADGLLVSFVF
jgi:hypothetical protein